MTKPPHLADALIGDISVLRAEHKAMQERTAHFIAQLKDLGDCMRAADQRAALLQEKLVERHLHKGDLLPLKDISKDKT